MILDLPRADAFSVQGDDLVLNARHIGLVLLHHEGLELAQTVSYAIAKRSIEKTIPEVITPVGVNVKFHPMESKEERIKYTELENQFYQGVVYRSVNMLEWMMFVVRVYGVYLFCKNGTQGIGCLKKDTTISIWRPIFRQRGTIVPLRHRYNRRKKTTI